MINYNKFTLDNGLRVIHNYDPSTAMVGLNLLYDVGSRDENPELTGLAHLFEHLMFGGSVNVPDFDGPLEAAGGKNNAFTTNDITNFYEFLPAQNVETAFWLESDRMLGIDLSPKALEVQRSVVIEEFKQRTLNRPYGDEDHLLRGAAYSVHPYRFPVIGREISHIERVTADDAMSFYYSHYAPNNAILAITGNITLEQARHLTEKWFGPIPRREVAPRLYAQEPPQTDRQLIEASATNIPATDIVIAWHMDRYGTPDYYAADMLTDILACGQSSRMYRQLVMGTDLFTTADAAIQGAEEPGLLYFKLRLAREGKDIEEAAIDAALNLVDDLTRDLVTTHEMQRSINRNDTARDFADASYMNRALSLAMAEYHGVDINTEPDRYTLITPEQLRETACKIFRPENSTTLIYRKS